MATTTAGTAVTEATTASAPDRPRFDGRPDHGAAAARTEQLFSDHRRLVSGLCRGLLRDRAEAEDAAQQTFLSAHRALLNGSTPTQPAAWLATIARNECWARIKTRMQQPLPTAEVEDERSSADPVEEAIRNADLAALWSAIAALPQQQRDALLLREFGGLSYAELAGALAVTGAAVESLLFRARHGVRARLEAAYAALTGASWLESLARAFGGIGGGMAPVAAKVAVVSVGAAVATGGYVAAPHVLRRQTEPFRPAQTRAAMPPPAAVLVARMHRSGSPGPVSRPVAAGDSGRQVPAPARQGSGREGSDDGEATPAPGSDRSGNSQESDHGSGRASTTAERSSAEEKGSSSGSEGSDGGGGRSSGSPHGSGEGSDGGSGGGDGSRGGSGEGEDHHGGDAATVPNPAVTATLTATGPAPAVGDPAPVTGG